MATQTSNVIGEKNKVKNITEKLFNTWKSIRRFFAPKNIQFEIEKIPPFNITRDEKYYATVHILIENYEKINFVQSFRPAEFIINQIESFNEQNRFDFIGIHYFVEGFNPGLNLHIYMKYGYLICEFRDTECVFAYFLDKNKDKIILRWSDLKNYLLLHYINYYYRDFVIDQLTIMKKYSTRLN